MYRTIFKHASAAALMAAGISTVFTAPAQAQFEGDGPGVVGACTNTGANIFGAVGVAGTYTCRAGDKLYSKFTILATTTNIGALNNASFTFSDDDPDHTLNVSGSFLTGKYNFTYQMDIVGPNIPLRDFGVIRTGATTSATSGVNTWTNTLSAVPATAPGIVVSTDAATPSGLASFGTGVKSAVFTTALDVTSGRANVLTQSMTQRNLEEVPGPLSILGAGVAFGFSRKLRKRIGAVA